jgi:hypothetical protein
LIIEGDCLERLRELPSESLDSLVTDPPAGIGFMSNGKKDHWDSDKGGRTQWVAWMTEVMRECLRVLKPGAHGLVWALPRMSHWTATALEDAGFEVRDVITHLFGSGFPKSMCVSKAIDKAAGAKREVVGEGPKLKKMNGGSYDSETRRERTAEQTFITAAATDAARKWEGFGTALKPSNEHWILVRRPLSEKTVAANVLKHGTGALNIDACRVNSKPRTTHAVGNIQGTAPQPMSWGEATKHAVPGAQGRFPANLILSHQDDCELVGMKKVKTSQLLTTHKLAESDNQAMSGKNYARSPRKDWGADGTETVESWKCSEGCAVAELDRQSGTLKTNPGTARSSHKSGMFGVETQAGRLLSKGDSGGASRFFYVAKASKSDRNHGCEDLITETKDGPKRGNTHPTCKSTKLMGYLIRLVTPPGGTVLDPFMGSGSTGVAAIREGMGFVGIEQNPEYIAIAKARLDKETPCSPAANSEDASSAS